MRKETKAVKAAAGVGWWEDNTHVPGKIGGRVTGYVCGDQRTMRL